MALTRPRQIDRQVRLQQLATEWGVASPPAIAPLTRPLPSPLSAAAQDHGNDDSLAEELLKRRRLNAGQERSSGLRRAFTTKKKTWEAKEILEALDAHVTNKGSPGVARALIGKLKAAGSGLEEASSKRRSSLLPRGKSLGSTEKSLILRKAVENGQTDMVSVLAHYADTFALDSALPVAIRSGDLTITQELLQHGANTAQTSEGISAFRQLCAESGHADLVALILQSEGRPAPSLISQAMVDASRRGCLETVHRLSRSTADGNCDNAKALKEAISQCRVDIALAILTGTMPPSPGSQGLAECFTQLFQHPAIRPHEKIAFAEALLCAGVTGDAVSNALIQACATEFYEMVELLVDYGASIEYQDAIALRTAVSRGQTGLVQLLVNEKTSLSPIYASESVECIPKTLTPGDRQTLLSILLRKGARGAAIDGALIDAVEARDAESVHLLLAPHFPGGGTPVENHHHLSRKPSRGMVFDRHETASVDYKDGLALRIAVVTGDLAIVQQLLAVKPSPETISKAMPQIHGLTPAGRFHMAECLLSAGAPPLCISAALQVAVEEEPPRRDENLIVLLLRNNADVNFNNGAGISAAIAHRDVRLLDTLLKSMPAPRTIAMAVRDAINVDDKLARYRMMCILLQTGAVQGAPQVSDALARTLGTRPLDITLATLLLEQGKADVNFEQGLPVVHAIQDPDPAVLDLVLQKGKPNAQTLRRGLDMLSDMPTDDAKAAKLRAILELTSEKDPLDTFLVKEVRSVLRTPVQDRHPTQLAVVKTLVSSGADVNAHTAASLCHAVGAADLHVADLLFDLSPSPASLAVALRHSLHIPDAMDRLSFTQRIIAAGVPGAEANRALVYAVEAFSDDVSLIGVLASRADVGDGEALLLAVKQENPDVVEQLLAKAPKKYAVGVLNTAFGEVTATTTTKPKDRAKRLAICTALLKAGASGTTLLSDALLAAAADGDLTLGALLIDRGASVDHREGQAIVAASGAGAAEVLSMLLCSKTADVQVQMRTLERGFQAATQIGDLKKRGEIFRLLLEKGVAGEVVNSQLVSAARFGEDGRDLVSLLLEFGADVDYANGEAVWTATRSAIMGSLELMLGIEAEVEDTGEEDGEKKKVQKRKKKKPSKQTLLRALKASRMLSRDPRYQVIEWLFAAGLPATEDIHTALNKAVKEDPDIRLVKLLLDHGASPLVNGCETLIDAAQLLAVDILAVLLEKTELSGSDASWIFKHAFTPETAASTWLSTRGLEVAKMLLEKGKGKGGIEGDSLSHALSAAIDALGSSEISQDVDTVARQFVELLIASKANVNFQDGLVLQKAAKAADAALIRQIFKQKPNSLAVSMAFPYIFDCALPEEETLELMSLFTEHHDGEERLDVMFAHPESEPIVFRAAAQFPRSVKILETLLDAGYYHDPVTSAQVIPELVEDEEQVSLLLWMLLQPQKRVSSGLVDLLIDRGANINFETDVSKMTPLLVAIRTRRPDIVGSLILAGAEVDVIDITGNTPLTLATRIGGDLGTTMMSRVLAAEPSKNDGSLHNAARELNLQALQVLMEFGHEVDFPSPLHGGRSALGELCLNASHAGPLTPAQEKQMERIMTLLLERGTDPSLRDSDGKSVLLLAMSSPDPVTTTRSLLKVGLWKHLNQACNNFSDGTYTYSPTQYVARVMPRSDVADQLLRLLKANRGVDTFYANANAGIPQPPDATNLPSDLEAIERERQARARRAAHDDEDHARAIAHTHDLARVQSQIFVARAELEDARSARRRADDIAGLRARSALQDELFAAEVARRRQERELERREGEEGLARARQIAAAQEDAETRRRERALEWERDLGNEKVRAEKALGAVRRTERREMERFDTARDIRLERRVAMQRDLVESQDMLARRLAGPGPGPGGSRRQIEYLGDLN